MTDPCRALALAGLLLGAACGTRDVPAGNPTRGDPAVAFPADPSVLASYLHVDADSLLAAGLEIYDRGAYDSAEAIWQVELGRARRSANRAAEARVLMWLGLAGRKLGDYAASRRDGEASLALKRQLGLDGELAQSFNALGLLAWNEGRLQGALELFDSAMASARRNGDAPGVARATANIPLVQTELGDFDGARQGFHAAYTAFRAIDDRRGQGNALANLAMIEIRLGNPGAALPLLADARHQYAGRYPDGEANALGQRATAWSALGDLQRAIADADSGLAVARAYRLQQESAAILEVLADLHLQAGSPRLALGRLKEADSIDAVLGLAVERGNNLRRSAAILLELGEASASAARAQLALAAHLEVEAHAEVVQDRLQLALALWQSGEQARAASEAETALKEAAAIANPATVGDAAAVAAQLALRNGDAKRALRYAAQSPAVETTNDWALADLRAGALAALGRLGEARAEGERAVALLERERGTLAVGPLRSAYFMNRVGPFTRLVAIDLERGDTAAAFRVSVSLPGRALAERLGGMPDTIGPMRGAAEGERVLRRIEALEQDLADLEPAPADAERRAGLTQALDRARSAYEEAISVAASSPGDRQLGRGAVSLSDVQSQLADDEAFLTFLSGPERLDLFLVRRHSVFHESSEVGSRDLALRTRAVRELLAGRPAPEVYAELGELHRLLLGPVIDAGVLKGVARLFIVPHGSLAALPFAALWNQRTGRFLVEDFVVTYLPTATAMSDRGPALAHSTDRLAVFAPLPDSLPGTVREARSILRLIPAASVRVGRASSEPEVRRALEAGDPVHLASHGSQNSQNPLFSQVVAGQRSGAGPERDGRLEVQEILRIRTTSPMIFLSGCETGLVASGLEPFSVGMEEGSLAQAFLVAGAGAVVGTLWRVHDMGAAELAPHFYRHLQPGVSAAEALALGQREVIGSGSGTDWAAYAVWGTGERKTSAVVRATGVRP